MPYLLALSDQADKKFKKLQKKNKHQLEAIQKKLLQVLENPYHFKPLMGDMHGARRVHIDSSFVLVYQVLEKEKIVRVLDYNHHDKIY